MHPKSFSGPIGSPTHSLSKNAGDTTQKIDSDEYSRLLSVVTPLKLIMQQWPPLKLFSLPPPVHVLPQAMIAISAKHTCHRTPTYLCPRLHLIKVLMETTFSLLL